MEGKEAAAEEEKFSGKFLGRGEKNRKFSDLQEGNGQTSSQHTKIVLKFSPSDGRRKLFC